MRVKRWVKFTALRFQRLKLLLAQVPAMRLWGYRDSDVMPDDVIAFMKLHRLHEYKRFRAITIAMYRAFRPN